MTTTTRSQPGKPLSGRSALLDAMHARLVRVEPLDEWTDLWHVRVTADGETEEEVRIQAINAFGGRRFDQPDAHWRIFDIRSIRRKPRARMHWFVTIRVLMPLPERRVMKR